MLNYYSGQLKRGIFRCALNQVQLERVALFYAISTPPAIVILLLCRLRPACFFLLSSIVPHGMRGVLFRCLCVADYRNMCY